MFELSNAGGNNEGRAFDLFTRAGKFAGLLVETYGKGVKVYFDSNASKGSARNFNDVPAALDFIHARRIKKGWSV